MSNPDIPDSLPPGFGGEDNPIARAAVERASDRLGPILRQVTNQKVDQQAMLSQVYEIGSNLLSAIIWCSALIAAIAGVWILS